MRNIVECVPKDQQIWVLLSGNRLNSAVLFEMFEILKVFKRDESGKILFLRYQARQRLVD